MIKTGFSVKTPDQWADLVERHGWLLSDRKMEPVSFDRWNLDIVNAFDRVYESFLYVADTKGPWGACKEVEKTFSDGCVMQGDCDYFAIECLHNLNKVNLTSSAMRLIVCETEKGESHMVSAVETDSGTIVFDCRFDCPVTLDEVLERGYTLKLTSSPTGKWFMINER